MSLEELERQFKEKLAGIYDAEELEARMTLVNDPDFRRYVNDDCDICDIPSCNVDLVTMYENYLGVD